MKKKQLKKGKPVMTKHRTYFVDELEIVEEGSITKREQLVNEADRLYPGNTPKVEASVDGFIYNEHLDVTEYFVTDTNGKTQVVFAKGE
jgi:hypothetical protein